MLKNHLYRFVILALLATAVFAPTPASALDCLSTVNAPGCAFGLPAEQYNALLPAMNANPEPAVRPLPVDGETVKRFSGFSGAEVRNASSFTGALIDGPLPFPMAWVITSTRPSAVPGRAPDSGGSIVPRYSRVYLFAMVKAQGWKWY